MVPSAARTGRTLFAIVLVMVALATPARGTFPGRSGKIAFGVWGWRGHGGTIFRVSSDGRRSDRLTGNDHINSRPRFSADGRWIVYERDLEIWMMRADGTAKRAVIRHREGKPQVQSMPTWSPDGRRIAVVAWRHGQIDVFVKRLGAVGMRRITNDTDHEYLPVWSPLGRRILFTSVRDANADGSLQTWDVWSIRTDGTGLRRVTDTDAHELSFDWSPDGRWILFGRKSSPDFIWELWESRPDGTGAHRITTMGYGLINVEAGASYSPDGDRIVFQCESGLCMTDRAGERRRSLDLVGGQPTWQPVP